MKIMPPRRAVKQRLETAGEALAGGPFIEIVKTAPGSADRRLLIWDGKGATIRRKFDWEGKTYVPARLDSTLGRALRLPTGVASYGSPRDLFDEICRLLAGFVNLPDRAIAQVVYFVFGTWLVDRVSVAPLLSILTSPAAPGATLMLLLSVLCRHALLLGGVNGSELANLPMLWRPTLLLDVVEPSGPLQKFLRASSMKGIFIFRRGRVLDVFCAKAICSHEPLSDAGLRGLALEVALPPTPGGLPVLDCQKAEESAEEFQAKLLMYRLKTHREVPNSVSGFSELSAPTQTLGRNLAACVVGDQRLQSDLLSLLRPQDEELRVERASGLLSVIVEALLFVCHEENRFTIRVGELADIVNTIFAERRERLEVSPETVGWKLKTLGFRSEPIGSSGKGLHLLDQVRAQIHRLAREFGVWSLAGMPLEGCSHCSQEFGGASVEKEA
jgi:hypothetical protein